MSQGKQFYRCTCDTSITRTSHWNCIIQENFLGGKDRSSLAGPFRCKMLLIAKGNPWKNGYVESVGDKLREEILNQELFLSLAEVRWVIDRWQLNYNHHLIQSALNYQTPAAYAAGCVLPASVTPQPLEYSRVTTSQFSHSAWYKDGGGWSDREIPAQSPDMALGDML